MHREGPSIQIVVKMSLSQIQENWKAGEKAKAISLLAVNACISTKE